MAMGIPGAFVIAYNDSKRVSVQEAQRALKERESKKTKKDKPEKN